jgi:hypothetical protein
MLSIITLLPLLLVIPSALASPVAGPRAVTLASPGHPGLFPDGIFNEEIAKRDVLRIIDKYQRRGQHEKAVRLAGKRRNRKRAVATVPMTGGSRCFFNNSAGWLALTLSWNPQISSVTGLISS